MSIDVGARMHMVERAELFLGQAKFNTASCSEEPPPVGGGRLVQPHTQICVDSSCLHEEI